MHAGQARRAGGYGQIADFKGFYLGIRFDQPPGDRIQQLPGDALSTSRASV